MTFRRSNQKPRTKKSHVMETKFLSPVKNTVKNMKNSQKIREYWFLWEIKKKNIGRINPLLIWICLVDWLIDWLVFNTNISSVSAISYMSNGYSYLSFLSLCFLNLSEVVFRSSNKFVFYSMLGWLCSFFVCL